MALFTRMQVVEDVTGGTLQQVVDETVATGAKIECDGYRFNRRKTGDRSSCAWQEPSLHLVLCCVKPISTYKENGRPKANTNKDNNEIPRRAKEVLPGKRKDFSFVQNSAGLHPRPEDAV